MHKWTFWQQISSLLSSDLLFLNYRTASLYHCILLPLTFSMITTSFNLPERASLVRSLVISSFPWPSIFAHTLINETLIAIMFKSNSRCCFLTITYNCFYFTSSNYELSINITDCLTFHHWAKRRPCMWKNNK